MQARERFDARVERDEESSGLYFEVPLDLRAVFGRARPPVRTTVHGHTWRTTPGVYGGRAYIALNREVRNASAPDRADGGTAPRRNADAALDL